MRMKVSPSAALSILRTIPHDRCQRGIRTRWRTVGGQASAQSALWLYCWAKTGMGSAEAADAARRAFDAIFDIPYGRFAARVPHDWAQRNRYNASPTVARELQRFLEDGPPPTPDTAAAFRHASYREKIIEHAFISDVLRRLWLRGVPDAEVLRPEVDGSGYDLVLRAGPVTRHIQLKSLTRGAKTAHWKIALRLGDCPSGCVVVIGSDPATLDIGPFLWFGGSPGQPLPAIAHLPVARHTKGNAEGVKHAREHHRVLSRAQCTPVPDIDGLLDRLFGSHLLDGGHSCLTPRGPAESPNDPHYRHAVRLLAMLHELHKRGYQRLRFSAGLSPAGDHWRCAFTAADNVRANGWEPLDPTTGVAACTTGDGAHCFGWADAAEATPSALADLFVARFPHIARRAAGPDWPYAGWFVAVLGAAEDGRLPVFYADQNLGDRAPPGPPPPPTPLAEEQSDERHEDAASGPADWDQRSRGDEAPLRTARLR